MEKGDDAFINTLHELLEPEITSETAFAGEIKAIEGISRDLSQYLPEPKGYRALMALLIR